jgi:regulator of protease activity HflC (stomatin/prohibitin superfamily)
MQLCNIAGLFERRVQIFQASAEKEAAQLRADAIAIIGKAAQDFPEYRTQEFIGAFAEALKEGKVQQVMYIPTEANIPITEAGRRPVPTKREKGRKPEASGGKPE